MAQLATSPQQNMLRLMQLATLMRGGRGQASPMPGRTSGLPANLPSNNLGRPSFDESVYQQWLGSLNEGLGALPRRYQDKQRGLSPKIGESQALRGIFSRHGAMPLDQLVYGKYGKYIGDPNSWFNTGPDLGNDAWTFNPETPADYWINKHIPDENVRREMRERGLIVDLAPGESGEYSTAQSRLPNRGDLLRGVLEDYGQGMGLFSDDAFTWNPDVGLVTDPRNFRPDTRGFFQSTGRVMEAVPGIVASMVMGNVLGALAGVAGTAAGVSVPANLARGLGSMAWQGIQGNKPTPQSLIQLAAGQIGIPGLNTNLPLIGNLGNLGTLIRLGSLAQSRKPPSPQPRFAPRRV